MRTILHLVVNRIVMPLGALLLLVAIGHRSDRLLGQYALVTSFYFVMQTLPLLGLTPYVLREVARAPAAAGRYFTTIGALAVASCVAINAALLLGLPALDYAAEVALALHIVGLSIVPGILAFLAELILLALGRSRSIAFVTPVENALRLAGSLLILAAGGGIVPLMLMVFAGRLGAFAAYLPLLRRALPPAPATLRIDAAILRRTLHVLPVFLTGGVAYLLVSRLDFLLLSLDGEIVQVGYYGIAYRAYEIGMLLGSAVTTALFARQARGFARFPAAFGRMARSLVTSLLLLATPLAAAGAVAAPLYVLLLFPREYPQPVAMTRLFILLLVPGFLDQVLAGLLNAADRQRQDTVALVAGGGVFVAALCLLVPRWHALGACIAMVLTVSTQLGLRLTFVTRAFAAPLPGGTLLRWAVTLLPLLLPALNADPLWRLGATLVALALHLLLLRWIGLAPAQTWRPALRRIARAASGRRRVAAA